MSGISTFAYLMLTLAIGYAFVYPSFGEISTLFSEQQKYEDVLATVENIENKKSELLTEFNKIPAEDKKSMETILPDSFNFVRLSSQIDAIGAKYGISISNISSQNLSPSAESGVVEGGPQELYQSGSIKFSFKSSYDTFNAFINDLEKSLRVLDIKSLKITTQKDGIYFYDVEFETYWVE